MNVQKLFSLTSKRSNLFHNNFINFKIKLNFNWTAPVYNVLNFNAISSSATANSAQQNYSSNLQCIRSRWEYFNSFLCQNLEYVSVTEDDFNPGLTNKAVNKILMGELVKGKHELYAVSKF